MRNLSGVREVLVIALFVPLATACGAPAPAAAPPPPPPAAPPPPPAPVASSAPAPVAAPAPTVTPPAPPAEARRPMHHGYRFEARLMDALDAVELRPDQKTSVDSIESDLSKLHDVAKEARKKLVADVADGVAAGKIDKAKTDADIRALGTAVGNATPTVQDAFNRLYKTLDAEQRKKLVAALRERAPMHGPHEDGGPHPGMHGMGGPGMHGGGPGGPPGAPGGPGMQGGMGGPGMHGGGPGGPGGPGMQGGMGGAPGAHGMGAEHGGPGMHGAGPGTHEGGPGMHEGGPGMHGGPLAKLSEDLGLSPEQTEKLRAKFEASMKANHAAMKSKHDAAVARLKTIADAFEGDKFDAKKLGIGSQGPEMAKDMAKRHVEFVQMVLSVLTPEQRAKFAEHIRAHGDDDDHEDDDHDD